MSGLSFYIKGVLSVTIIKERERMTQVQIWPEAFGCSFCTNGFGEGVNLSPHVHLWVNRKTNLVRFFSLGKSTTLGKEKL